MAYQLQEINEAIRRDTRTFLKDCDAAYQGRLEAAANAIEANMECSRIALLSGPSGSGKTTTALKLEENLRSRGILTRTVSMDNYFRTLTRDSAPRNEFGDIDYESPDYMDMPLLHEHFERLERGETVHVPHFEFARQMRNDALGTPLHLAQNEVAIFEGIHALNDEIAGRHQGALGIYISARSDVLDGAALAFKGTWMRLVRRCVRDYQFRGTGVFETMNMWANVRRGEKLYISPFKHRAKVIIDSSFPYEVPVMKSFALPIFQEVLDRLPPDAPRIDELKHLISSFERFASVDSNLVEPSALLREFIGGGVYDAH